MPMALFMRREREPETELMQDILRTTSSRRELTENIDGRINVVIVQGTIKIDVALSDVSRQIRNGVRDVIVGHSENGNLGD